MSLLSRATLLAFVASTFLGGVKGYSAHLDDVIDEGEIMSKTHSIFTMIDGDRLALDNTIINIIVQ